MKRESVTLTEEQLQTILEETSGVVTIEQTRERFTHTYAQDSRLEREGRTIHVSLKGNPVECELV